MQKSARQRRPERLSHHNTEHVKNLNLNYKFFKTLQSVSPVLGIYLNKIPLMIPISGETDCRVLNFLILIFDVFCVMF